MAPHADMQSFKEGNVHLLDHIKVDTVICGHCWKADNEIVSDVLLWELTRGRAETGWSTMTFVKQLCVDLDCYPTLRS